MGMKPRKDMKARKTARGFDLVEFRDEYGNKCSIQKSSLADRDAIWFGVNDPTPIQGPPWRSYPLPPDVVCHTRMHLTRRKVAELLPILQHFVTTGELPEWA